VFADFDLTSLVERRFLGLVDLKR